MSQFYRVLLTGCTLLLLVSIISCNSSSTRLYNASQVEFVSIDSIQYLITIEHRPEIEACLSLDGFELPTYNKDDDGVYLENTLAIKRKLIKRGSAARGLPRYLIGKNVSFVFQHCANPEGQVVLTRTVEAGRNLSAAEQQLLLSYMFDYKYEVDNNAACMECGLYYIHIVTNGGKTQINGSTDNNCCTPKTP